MSAISVDTLLDAVSQLAPDELGSENRNRHKGGFECRLAT
jgi:hypothetical protein